SLLPRPTRPTLFPYTTLFRSLAGGRPGSTAPTAAALLERFRARTTPRFFAAFDQPADVVAVLRRRWPELEGRVLEAAECIRRGRSEEHTSELQSLAYLVCRLL